MRLKCQWCEKDLIKEPLIYCPFCKGLSRKYNWIISLLKVAVLPLAAVFITILFNKHQINQDRIQVLEQKYVQLWESITEFRKAGVKIELACISNDDTSCYTNIISGISDLDYAFHKIGHSIYPFIAYARDNGKKQLANEMDLTWLRCFQVPYHGNYKNFPKQERNWEKFRRILEKYCIGNKCSQAAGVAAEQVVFEIFSGKCYENKPAEPRDVIWFSDQAYKLIYADSPVGYPGERPHLDN